MSSEQEEKSTPRPWQLRHFDKDGVDEWMVVSASGLSTVALANTNDKRRAKADMSLIVTAVNERDQLLSSLVEKQEEIDKFRRVLLATADRTLSDGSPCFCY